MFVVIGIVILLVMVFGGFAITGGSLGPVLEAIPHEMLIIGGAAVGAIVTGNSMHELKALGGGFARAAKGPKHNKQDHIDVIILTTRLMKLLRSEGPVALESHVQDPGTSAIFAEFPRILVHEVAHFIWVRLGNPKRHSYENLIRSERAPGELGWSAEWRKNALAASDIEGRTRRWREYCCESFCDTAAYLYSGLKRHPEFTIAGNLRRNRTDWFQRTLDGGPLSI